MYYLEERSASTAIRYKNCAQIIVSNINKSPIRYTIPEATESCLVQCEHGLACVIEYLH